MFENVKRVTIASRWMGREAQFTVVCGVYIFLKTVVIRQNGATVQIQNSVTGEKRKLIWTIRKAISIN